MSEYLRKVAIIGASGTIGKPTLDALIRRGKHEISVITRPASKATFPEDENVVVKRGEYSDGDFMQSALQGQDVLIVMLAFAGWRDQETIFQAAAKAGVRYVLPSDYGSDSSHAKMRESVSVFQMQFDNHAKVQDLGMKFISVVTNPWLDYILEHGNGGFNIVERKATIYPDSGHYMTTTTPKAGEGIAAMLALPKSKIESDFADNYLYLSSFRVTHEELFAAVLQATNTRESDWTVERKPVGTLIEDGRKKVEDGDFTGNFGLLFGANYSPGYGGDYMDKSHSKQLQLPEEDLVEVIRGVVRKLEA